MNNFNYPTEDEHNLRIIQSSIKYEEAKAESRRTRDSIQIMVIEDNPFASRMMQSILNKKYSVTVCDNVKSAVNEYFCIMPDLVFLDIELGGMYNGLDVLYTLTSQDREARIIIVTSHDLPKHKKAALKAGAYGFIAKSFPAAKLLSYADDCEEKRKSRSF